MAHWTIYKVITSYQLYLYIFDSLLFNKYKLLKLLTEDIF